MCLEDKNEAISATFRLVPCKLSQGKWFHFPHSKGTAALRGCTSGKDPCSWQQRGCKSMLVSLEIFQCWWKEFGEKNLTNSWGEENYCPWKIEGLVWFLLKGGSTERALKHLQVGSGRTHQELFPIPRAGSCTRQRHKGEFYWTDPQWKRHQIQSWSQIYSNKK